MSDEPDNSWRNYKGLTDVNHVLTAPDMYIDCIVPMVRDVYILNGNGSKKIMTDIPLGLERLFIELIANACDNIDKSLRQGLQSSPIYVWMDDTTITVRNGGLPVPVEMHEEAGMWTPEFVFGTLRVGSNFTGHRHGCLLYTSPSPRD